MITEVKAYSSLQSAPQLLLVDNGRAETDFIQIRDIQGLDPVAASIGAVPLGSSDGEVFTGSSVRSRNIVLTVHPNPDWSNWTFEGLRRLLYAYFMPKQDARLVFYSDDMPTVDIQGVVESVTANPFSSDPELLVSIICTDPYFKTISPITLSGENGDIVDIDYKGNIESGVQIRVDWVSNPEPTSVKIQNLEIVIEDPSVLSSTQYLQVSSLPKDKYIKRFEEAVEESLLSFVKAGSEWPTLVPGDNQFTVITDAGTQIWELQYSERFGGL